MATRDVIWITIESARQDHTTLGGHHRDTTPSLAALAERGTAFEQCHTHDIWTRPSSASILTGRASSAHQTWSNDARLPDAVRTIPEAFSAAGYRTACCSPNGQLSPATGLDRGFEQFHYLHRGSLREEAGPRALAGWLARYRQHTGGLTLDGSQHCLGYLQNRIARREIDAAADSDDPLFLYVHHGDSHHAYVPPLAWRDRFAADLPMSVGAAVDLALSMSADLHEYIAAADPFTDAEWQALRVMYDTTLSYVDHLVGRLVEYARTRLDDPIVVVTGDHGELFGEHGLLAHMLVTDTAVSNVPLVVDGIPDLPEGGLIQHADVMAMLCATLDIDHEVPVGRDVRRGPRSFAVTQRGGARARGKLDAVREYDPEFGADFHTGDVTSIRTEQWRYAESEDRSALYELPEERATRDHPDVADHLSARLAEWADSHGRPAGEAGAARFDADARDQLRDLGYLQ